MPGGGYRAGAGRPKSPVKAAIGQAQGDPLRQVEILGQFIRDKSLPVRERVRAAHYLIDLVLRLERKVRK